MPLNIPMPGLPGDALLKGLETGSGLFSRYMQPILQREAQAQQAQQFGANLGQRQSEQAQAQENFLKELEMRKQQIAQAHAFDSIKKSIMQQQLLRLQHSNDPMYEFQQFQNMAKMFGGGDEGQANPGQSSSPFGEGQGVFNPEAMQQPHAQSQNGMNLNAFKQNPMLRGFFKHKFGYDPLAQPPLSPEEKLQNDITKSIKIDEAKNAIKETKDIEDTATPLLQAAKHLESLQKIFLEKPNRTGPLAGRFSNAPLLNHFYDNATIKEINAHAVPLQGEIAGKLATRPGFGVLKIAESAKPSVTDTHEGNVASILANKEAVIESFKLMKDKYERLNPGKEFPYKLPEGFEKNPFKNATINNTPPPAGHKWIISPKGKRLAIPDNEVAAALKAGGKRG